MTGPGQEPRVPKARYRDPLDEIWLGLARRLGLRIVRTPEAYASTDGRGTLIVGSEETLDPDDCLAQMVLHELCHWLVEGDEAREQPDWGLDNQSDRDVPREQACLRLQAELTRRHGLRRVLAPTTDFRVFYDALPADPLAPRSDESSIAARLGLQRASREPWHPFVEQALAATAAIVRQVAPFAGRELDAGAGAPSLHCDLDATPVPHPTGLPAGAGHREHCGGCSWSYEAGDLLRCRRAEDQAVDGRWVACHCFEPELDCRTCAACCREGYEAVAVPPGDPVIEKRPELVVRRGDWIEIAREGERCAALEGSLGAGFACRIYEDRPAPCQELELGSANCLLARRRAGLSS